MRSYQVCSHILKHNQMPLMNTELKSDVGEKYIHKAINQQESDKTELHTMWVHMVMKKEELRWVTN